jgi:farnesyl diphosphate synthase
MATSKSEFESVFPNLVEDISAHAKQYNIPPEALSWLQKVPFPS